MQKANQLTTLLFLLFPILTFAQTICKGNVLDTEKQPIISASILVKDANDAILHFGFTDAKGDYKVPIDTEGDFILEISKMGFQKSTSTLKVTKAKTEYIQNAVLETKIEELDNIVITTEAAIQQRSDTLIYKAKAFTTGKEQVVEDLLKNIPGITVETSGTIKYNNQEIEKVMVGGDDLFNRGYSLLTKNMPNKPIDEVQVLKNYSNNKHLKGIENSEKVALNLTLGEEYKNVWFGDITAGYGLTTENRYDVTGNLMNFSNTYKNFLNYGLNNVGKDRVGDLESMFYNNTEVESIGSGSQLSTILNVSAARAPQLKDHRTRINNAENISLSSILPITPKLKVKFTGFLGFDENYIRNNSVRSVNLPDVQFTNTEDNSYKNHFKNAFVNLLATYDVSKTQMLQISSVFNSGNANVSNNLTFNTQSTLEKLQTKSTFFDQKATYTHKWKDKNVVLLKSRYFTNKLPQNYFINDYLMGDLFAFDADNMANNSKNNKQFIGVEADFKLKQKNDDLVEFIVGVENDNQDLKSNFTLFDGNNVSFTPSNFQTDASFSFAKVYAQSGYTLKFKDLKIGAYAQVNQLFNTFTNQQKNVEQNPFYVNPSLSLNWEFKPNNRIIAAYNLNFNNTKYLQVNDTYLLTNSRSFTKGLGEFKLTDSQNINLSYLYDHYLRRYSINLSTFYSTQSNTISTQSNLEQNSSLNQSIFIKGGQSYGVFGNLQYRIKPLQSNIKASIGANQSTYYNVINDSDLRKNTSSSLQTTFNWRTNFNGNFNFSLGSEWNKSYIKAPNFSNDFTNGFSYLDLYYDLNSRFELKSTLEHYYFGNLASAQRNHFFLDFMATYKFKNDKYTLSLTGKNLFNKKEFSTYNVSDYGYSTNNYSLMQRYVLLSFKYRFSL
nr:outer membrane beta-barrel protein [uncultured Flavobacterium sp.]